MLQEVSFGDILFAPIVLYGLIAIVIFVPLRWTLGRVGILRLLWHPALFEFALFLSIAVLVTLFFA